MLKDASTQFRQIAAAMGASGVFLGAMGAHKLNESLMKRGLLDSWRTAVLYQLFHASCLLGVSALCGQDEQGGNKRLVRAGQMLALGTTMFSGSIYLLCFGVGPKKILGPTTPLGGLLMIGGWVMLAASG